LQAPATEPKELLRIDQKTGPAIVLFRWDFARFDRAADDPTIRHGMQHSSVVLSRSV